MKKFLALLAAAALLLVFAMPALAEVANPLEGAKIYVAETFDQARNNTGTEDEPVYEDVSSGSWTDSQDAGSAFYGAYSTGPITTTLADGQLTFTGTGRNCFRLNTTKLADANAAVTGLTVTGIGFYVENNTPNTISIGTFMPSTLGGLFSLTGVTGGVLVTTDGTVTEGVSGTAGNWSQAMEVPAGFKGYWVLPAEGNIGDSWGVMGFNSLENSLTGSFGVCINDIEAAGTDNVVIDNFFYYGTDIPVNNDGVITFGGEEPNTDPGDLSMVAYALAAVTGLGSLTVLRRKK